MQPLAAPLITNHNNCGSKIGAGNEVRTRDLDLGKVALYQLSYTRKSESTSDSVKMASPRGVEPLLPP